MIIFLFCFLICLWFSLLTAWNKPKKKLLNVSANTDKGTSRNFDTRGLSCLSRGITYGQCHFSCVLQSLHCSHYILPWFKTNIGISVAVCSSPCTEFFSAWHLHSSIVFVLLDCKRWLISPSADSTRNPNNSRADAAEQEPDRDQWVRNKIHTSLRYRVSKVTALTHAVICSSY